jgi:signal recognition particle subunit SRP54
MMDEIACSQSNPAHETLFVVDAMTGQDAVNTAKAFNDILNFDGVILTKLDGDTVVEQPFDKISSKQIKFVGTGGENGGY